MTPERSQVWETELSGYDGDILFLEDDLRIAPDAFHALEFMSHAKHQGTRRELVRVILA